MAKIKLTFLETKFLQAIRSKTNSIKDGKYLQYVLEVSDRAIRTIKKQLIEKGILIGATPTRGYFEVKTKEDLKQAGRNYLKYIGAYSKMVATFNKKVIGQKKIKFYEGDKK
jgi:hypothetical protein